MIAELLRQILAELRKLGRAGFGYDPFLEQSLHLMARDPDLAATLRLPQVQALLRNRAHRSELAVTLRWVADRVARSVQE